MTTPIGIDPHKGSHTAVAIDRDERTLDEFRVRSGAAQADRHRQLNWAIHVVAVSQLRYDTPGRAFYDRKVAEGKTTKEAIRALKRRLSDVIYRHLVADARRREQQ